MVVLTHSTIWDRWGQSERFIYIWATGQSPQGCTAPPVSASVRLSSPQPGFTKYPALHLPFPRAASSPSCAELCPVLGTGRFPIALFPARSWKGHPTFQECSSAVLSYIFLAQTSGMYHIEARFEDYLHYMLHAGRRKAEGSRYKWALIAFCLISGRCRGAC